MKSLGIIVLGLSLSSGAIGEPQQLQSGKGTMGLADLCVLVGVPNARQLSQSEEAVLSLYMSTGAITGGLSDEQKAKDGMFKGAIRFCLNPAKATADVQALVRTDLEKN